VGLLASNTRPDLGLLSIAQLADLTHRAPKTIVKRLEEQGVRTAETDGGGGKFYRGHEALPAIYLDKRFDFNAEKARREKEAADKLALENAQAREELIPGTDLEEVLAAVWTAASQKLQGIGTKLAPIVVCAASAAEAKKLIDAAIAEALNELADAASGAEKAGASANSRRARGRARRRKAAA
jgi:hypothetical protein